MKNVIYKISNTINGRIYIGSAIDFNIRKRGHKSQLLNNKHHSKILQNFVNKYGFDRLIFEVVEYVDCKENLLNREQYFLDTLKPFFNIYKIAGSRLGKKHTEATKQKVSLSKKNPSQELRDRLSLASKGKKMTEQIKQKLRDINLGKKMSEDSKLKMSLIAKGNKHSLGTRCSDEKKLKISIANKGRKKSDETIAKLRISKKNISDETRKKMSIAKKGKVSNRKGAKLSEETKLKISLSQRNKKIINKHAC